MKLKKIAELAGVSISTISKVINNKPGISENKRKEIEKIIFENGFYKKNKTSIVKSIAIVIPDLRNPYFGEIIKNILEVLREKKHQAIIFDTNENYEIEKETITTIIKNGVDGVIMCISDGSKSNKSVELLYKSEIPVVLIDRELDLYQDGVFLNDFKASYLATEILIKEGHTSIGVVTGPRDLRNIKNRYNGFLAALKTNDLKLDINNSFEEDHLLHDVSKNLKTLLTNKNRRPSGIVCFNNFITLNLIKFINSQNLQNDISVIGFELPEYFDVLNLNINNVITSTVDMGKISAKLLLKKIDNNSKYSEKIILEPILKII